MVEPLESSVATMPGRGKRVNSTAKNIIFNVYKYFERESAKIKNRVPPKLTHKTAEATGYGERTVRRIVAEKSALSGAAFSSPAKRYKIDRKKIVIHDFYTEALRRTVHKFYSEKKYSTMDSLLLAVKEKGIFSEGSVRLCGKLCVRWDLSIRRSMTSDIYIRATPYNSLEA